MKIVNCDSVYDLLEDRSSRYRNIMKTNFSKQKMYKNIQETFAKI